QVGGDSPTMPSGSIDPVTDGILVDIDDTAGTPQRITFCQGPHRDRVIRFLHAYTEVRRALAHRKRALTHGAAIPHRGPDLDAFVSIKPRIPFSQELEQVLVLVSQIENHESLSGDVEHMNPHEVMEYPACGRVLDALTFLVWKGGSMLLEGRAD